MSRPDGRVNLHGLDLEVAQRALLAVDPDELVDDDKDDGPE